MTINPLPNDIKTNGVDQQSLVTFLQNVRDLVNELQTDHSTNKTTIDECRTAIIELIDDHATNKTTIDESRTAIMELIDDHDADNAGILTDLKTLLNDIRTHLTGDRLFSGNPAMVIDTNFDVKTGGACVVSIDGVLKNVALSASADTGTAATFPNGQWGIFLVSSNTAGSLTATWDDNSAAGYSSEASAIAALPAAPANEAPVGYVTVQADASNTFLAGTDALTTGTGGNPAQTTNYYNLADPLSTISAAVSSSPAAALTAPDPTASAATLTAGDPTASAAALTNSTALTLNKG